MIVAARQSGPTKLYGPAHVYEAKLRRVLERLDVKQYDWDHSRHEAWIEFRYRGQLYRFEQTVTRAQARGQKIHFGSDCFAQLVLGLEDLARLVKRGIYEFQTWITGMKALPAAVELPSCLRFMNFDQVPEGVEVRARYRELTKILHPDSGGNDEDFVALQAAYQEALAFVGAPEGGEAR